MKRTIFLSLACLASISLWAQPRITSDKEKHSFGQIMWKTPVTVDYTITNTGDEPLVLTNVTTSCACAVSEWTKTPIQPGKKGKVTATFDAKALGHFNKSVAIYSNAAPHLLYLNFAGEVVQKITDFSNQHPYAIGQILLDKDVIDFPDTHKGDFPELTISIVNQSDASYAPVLMHLPPYVTVKTEPNVLQKGERGLLKLTLDTERLTDLGLMQTSVYLSRFAGDKVSEENEIPLTAVLLPDFSSLTEIGYMYGPKLSLSETHIDLGDQLLKKNKVKHTITLTNAGKSTLNISKLQVLNPGIGVDLKKTSLAPGEKTTLKMTLDKKMIHRKKHLQVLMITNDPVQPKVIIDIRNTAN